MDDFPLEPPRGQRDPLSVSVIIPTKDRPERLAALLSLLREQRYSPVEVIVVDQSQVEVLSDAAIRDALGRECTVLRPMWANRSRAKNLGTVNASGDILLFLDDDVVIGPDLVESHVRAYSDPNVGAASCRLIESDKTYSKTHNVLRPAWYGKEISNAHSDTTVWVAGLCGGNMSIRRTVWDMTDGFDSRLGGASMSEESDIARQIVRAGQRILFTNWSTVVHVPQPDGTSALRHGDPEGFYYWRNHNEMLVAIKHDSPFRVCAVACFCVVRAIFMTVRFRIRPRGFWRLLRAIPAGLSTWRTSYVP